MVALIGTWGPVVSNGREPPQSAKERSLALQKSLLSRTLNLVDAQGRTISTAARLLNDVVE
jgi:hypothetical protein